MKFYNVPKSYLNFSHNRKHHFYHTVQMAFYKQLSIKLITLSLITDASNSFLLENDRVTWAGLNAFSTGPAYADTLPFVNAFTFSPILKTWKEK